MPEKCKLYNLESFTDEERQRVEDLINQIEEEKKAQKWWVMPKYSCFGNIALYKKYGPSYQVEPQQDSYSRSRPPLKSDFNSKEAAERWLKEYLEQETIFKSAINDIDNLVDNLNDIIGHLRKHEYIGKGEWHPFSKATAGKDYHFDFDTYEYKYDELEDTLYRPFKDTNELIAYWEKHYSNGNRPEYTMPLIWVKGKETGNVYLITGYEDDLCICLSDDMWLSLKELFRLYRFLDGKFCGKVKE